MTRSNIYRSTFSLILGLCMMVSGYAYSDTLYAEDGSVCEIGTLEDGLKDGTWLSYYPDGKLKSEGEFKHGFKHGSWTWYHPNGQVCSIEKWKNGIYKKGTYWDRQGEPSDISEVLTDPVYPGGIQAFTQMVVQNVEYPEKVYNKGIEGRVVLSFQINSHGEVINPVVKERVHPELDQEALRVLKLSDEWTPATFHGEFTTTSFTFPITFALQ